MPTDTPTPLQAPHPSGVRPPESAGSTSVPPSHHSGHPPEEAENTFQPVAAVLAFAFPGMGHVFLGHTRRGGLILGGIIGLFLSGLLIGGIDAVDREEDFFWFIAQSLVGPTTFGVNYVHQHHFKAFDQSTFNSVRTTDELATSHERRSARPSEVRVVGQKELLDARTNTRRVVSIPYFKLANPSLPNQFPPNLRGLGRANELGTLFCAVAGFMNLIAVIDASYHRRASRRTPGPTRKAVT